MSATPDASHPAIAFVVAHPDDVAFTMGGTALLLKERYRLHVLCATKGERGYPWSGNGRPPPSAEVAARREQEEAAACAILGAELEFLGEIDGDVFAGREVCEKVAERLGRIRPAALFTMGALEKADHAATFSIALHALQLADLFWTTELYANVNPGNYNTRADVYVNTSSVIDGKRRLMRCHPSQLAADAVDGVLEFDRFLGKQAWCDYAEAFSSSLVPIAVRWKRKAGSILMELAP